MGRESLQYQVFSSPAHKSVSAASLRKQIKIRPGYTPQEDVSRFRGSRQQQLDRTALPKGHIVGWVAPSSETKGVKKTTVPGAAGDSSPSGSDKLLSKSAAKNAKRKAKKNADKEKIILANWDDDADDEPPKKASGTKKDTPSEQSVDADEEPSDAREEEKSDALADELQKLDVR